MKTAIAFFTLFISTLSALAVPLEHAGHGGNAHGRARSLHKRAPIGSESQLLSRGQYSGRATYFAVGLGACGNYNKPSDFIVALDAAQFEAGGWCGKSITISYGGKTAHATIQDECPGCDNGSLDLSQGLFEFFAPTSVGEFQMTWSLGGADAPPTTTSTKPHTTTPTPTSTTSTPKPTPTTTYTPPTTTSTKTKTTSTSAPSSTSEAPSSSVEAAGTTSSSAAAPSTTSPSEQSVDNLGGLNQVLLGLGGIIGAAASLQ